MNLSFQNKNFTKVEKAVIENGVAGAFESIKAKYPKTTETEIKSAVDAYQGWVEGVKSTGEDLNKEFVRFADKYDPGNWKNLELDKRIMMLAKKGNTAAQSVVKEIIKHPRQLVFLEAIIFAAEENPDWEVFRDEGNAVSFSISEGARHTTVEQLVLAFCSRNNLPYPLINMICLTTVLRNVN